MKILVVTWVSLHGGGHSLFDPWISFISKIHSHLPILQSHFSVLLSLWGCMCCCCRVRPYWIKFPMKNVHAIINTNTRTTNFRRLIRRKLRLIVNISLALLSLTLEFQDKDLRLLKTKYQLRENTCAVSLQLLSLLSHDMQICPSLSLPGGKINDFCTSIYILIYTELEYRNRYKVKM